MDHSAVKRQEANSGKSELDSRFELRFRVCPEDGACYFDLRQDTRDSAWPAVEELFNDDRLRFSCNELHQRRRLEVQQIRD